MPSEPRSRRSILGLPWSVALLVAGAIFSTSAQAEQTIAEDLTVQGVLTLDDPANHPLLYFRGAPLSGVSTGEVGASISYEDAATGKIVHRINRLSAEWQWQVATSTPGTDRLQMKLDNGNILSLIDPTSGSASIILDPQNADPKITINGARVATMAEVAASYVPLLNPNALMIPTVYAGVGGPITGAFTVMSADGVFNGNPAGGSWFQGYDQTHNAVSLGTYYDPRSPGIEFQTLNNQVRLMITSDGNVGIGTTVPQVKFEVLSSTVASGTNNTEELVKIARPINFDISYQQVASFALGSFSENGPANGYGPNSRLDIRLKSTATNDFSTDVTAMSLLSNGRVGVGTVSPLNRLHAVNDTDYTQGASYAINAGHASNPALALLLGYDSTIDAGVIQAMEQNVTYHKNLVLNPNAGNVGIGTNAPQAKLEVGGSVKVNGPARFEDRVRIAPRGDISMGDFTTEPAP